MVEAAIWQTILKAKYTTNVDVTARNEKQIYATTAGRLYLLDTETGAVLTSRYLGDEVSGTDKDVRLHSYQDSILIVGYNGRVLGLHPASLKTLWNLNLELGDHIVNVGVKGGWVYAGCYGRLYKIERTSGDIKGYNNLYGLGESEVRFAFDPGGSDVIVVGTYGHARGISTSTMDGKVWSVELPGCGNEVVNVIYRGDTTYAGSNGYLYLLNPSLGIVQGIRFTPDGDFEIRLAFVDNQIIAAGNRFIKSYAADNLGKENWAIKPINFDSKKVALVKAGNKLVYVSASKCVYGLSTTNGKIVSGGPCYSDGGDRTNIMVNGQNAVVGAYGRISSYPLSIYKFIMQTQDASMLCWAAVTASISLYYNSSSGWAQCKLVQIEFDIEGDRCCIAGTPVPGKCNRGIDSMQRALSYTDNYLAHQTHPANIAELADQMGRLRPVCATIVWSVDEIDDEKFGHVVVICGVYPRPREVDTLLQIYDPGTQETSDHPQYITIEAFRKRYQGMGHWRYTYATKPAPGD